MERREKDGGTREDKDGQRSEKDTVKEGLSAPSGAMQVSDTDLPTGLY